MILAIMQPYFFPYAGYWQLLNHAEIFVIYDDVNYIKQGYVNRNSILANEKSQLFTLEVLGASSFKKINEVNVGSNSNKLIKTLQINYIKAPFYKEVMPLLEDILSSKEKNLAKYLGYSIEKISEYLKFKATIIYSSDVEKNSELKGQDKVINICNNLKASTYINAIGGQKLYDTETFKRSNIDLRFIKPNLPKYKQFNSEFVSGLSIIDVMMFNDIKKISSFMQDFDLI